MKKLLILSLAILCFYACKTTSSDTSRVVYDDTNTYEAYLASSGITGLYGFLMKEFCQEGLEHIPGGKYDKYNELHALYTDEVSTNKKIVIDNGTRESSKSSDILNAILKTKFEGYTVDSNNPNEFNKVTTSNGNKTSTYQKIFVSPEDSNSIIFEEYPGKDNLKSSMQAVENNQSQLLNRVVINKKTEAIEINLALGKMQTLSKSQACLIYERVLNIQYEEFETLKSDNKKENIRIEITQKSGKTQKEETRYVSKTVVRTHITDWYDMTQDIWVGWSGSKDPNLVGYPLEDLPFKSTLTTNGCYKQYKDTIVIPIKLSNGDSSAIKKDISCKETEKIFSTHLLDSVFILHNPKSDDNFVW